MWDQAVLVPTILFTHAFLKVWIISEACTRLVEDRRSGALELLLSSPLGVKEIIRGQHLALYRQFGGPLLLLISLEAVCFLFGIFPDSRKSYEFYFLPSAIVLLVADFFTLRWVAMWIGLNSKNVNRAVLKTAMLVLALPWIIYGVLANLIPLFYVSRASTNEKQLIAAIGWLGLALLADWILFCWAKPKLLTQFRPLATQAFRTNSAG
jgi:hypothetical protein